MRNKPMSQAEWVALRAEFKSTLMDIPRDWTPAHERIAHAERALSPRLALEHAIGMANSRCGSSSFIDVDYKTVTRFWSRQDMVRELVWC